MTQSAAITCRKMWYGGQGHKHIGTCCPCSINVCSGCGHTAGLMIVAFMALPGLRRRRSLGRTDIFCAHQWSCLLLCPTQSSGPYLYALATVC